MFFFEKYLNIYLFCIIFYKIFVMMTIKDTYVSTNWVPEIFIHTVKQYFALYDI